ncbi:PTS sugar transporter subunit IIC [Clostridium sp. KNHs214]|uniref:PTS sugar transporter subunit IIC n=1 Tax=Clostridium sp. KNHs214 TaxID=1540257 RepID=UPI00068B6B83|nr:PTS sugar transporter subunit IIC [Clostridium sp. KNHs214]
MFVIVKGLGLLILALVLFSIFSLKAPKGDKAMSGLANAAVASFLVEAIHKYIGGNFLGLKFIGEVGATAGSLSGPAAAILVALNMGVNPVYAVVMGVAVGGLGILPGFIAGYLVSLIAPKVEEKLPEGLNIIFGALLLAPLARFIAVGVNPIVNSTLLTVGDVISVAANQSPIVMGFLLGGIMKIICTSPLSSMAITAMLGLKGLAMGIAGIACVGGAFANGVTFKRLKLGENSKVIAVMLEPLTQADIVTANPLPIYGGSFLGGALAGLSAAYFKIVNNAPGTASPIPGFLASFGFNKPLTVLMSAALAIVGGIIGGLIVSQIFKMMGYQKRTHDNVNVESKKEIKEGKIQQEAI